MAQQTTRPVFYLSLYQRFSVGIRQRLSPLFQRRVDAISGALEVPGALVRKVDISKLDGDDRKRVAATVGAADVETATALDGAGSLTRAEWFVPYVLHQSFFNVPMTSHCPISGVKQAAYRCPALVARGGAGAALKNRIRAFGVALPEAADDGLGV